MRTSSDLLFQLIHSLSPTEKRYFKIFASRHVIGNQNNYLKLFDFIEKLEEYDEEKVKKRFIREKFSKYLSAEKAYLTGLILKSMRSFNAEKTIDGQLGELLNDIRFLYEKNLLSQCQKLIDKATQLAIQYERTQVLFELLDWKSKIIVQKPSAGAMEQLNEIATEEDSLLESLKAGRAMFRLNSRSFFLISQKIKLDKAERLEWLLELSSHPLLNEERKNPGFEFTLKKMSTQAHLAQLEGKHEEVHRLFKEIVQHWEAHPHFAEAEGSRYRKALSDYMSSAFQLQQYEAIPQTLEKIKAIPINSFREEVQNFQIITYLELYWYMNTSRFEEASRLVPEIQKGLESYLEFISEPRQLAFFYNICILYFVLENFDESLTWLNKILMLQQAVSREDIRMFAGLLSVILHYELNNRDIIDYLLRNTRRQLSKHKGLNDFEQIVLQKMRQIFSSASPKEKIQLFHLLRDELKKLMEDPANQNLLGLNEVACWAQSRASGQPLRIIVEAKAEDG